MQNFTNRSQMFQCHGRQTESSMGAINKNVSDNLICDLKNCTEFGLALD